MQQYTLSGNVRIQEGRKVKKLRTNGVLPATIYGNQVKSVSIELPLTEFEKVYKQAGETGLIDLVIDGKKLPVLIHTVQIDAVNEKILHVEFYQVDLKEKVKTNVPIVLVGVAPVASEKKGVLLSLITEIEVEALPSHLPDKLEVSIELFTEVGQELKVSDIRVPSDVKVITEPDVLVIKVSPLVSKEAQKAQADAEAAAAAQVQAEVAEAPKEGEAPGVTAEEKPSQE